MGIESDFVNFQNSIKATESRVHEMISNIPKMVNKLSTFNEDIVRELEKLKDIGNSLLKFDNIQSSVFIQSGWFFCPSMGLLPFDYFYSPVFAYQSGRMDRVTALMKLLYGKDSWKFLEDVVNGWPSNKLFSKQRKVIIQDALWAHKNKKYSLSIPALLPIIEGICGDFCKSNKIQVSRNDAKNKVEASLKHIEDKFFTDLCLEFIEKQLYNDTNFLRSSKNKKFLNRHSILHGLNSGYSDCARSLRCFLLLDVLTLLSDKK